MFNNRGILCDYNSKMNGRIIRWHYTLDMCDSLMAECHHPQIYCPYENRLEVHCGEEEVAVGSSACRIISHTLRPIQGRAIGHHQEKECPLHVCHGPEVAC